MKTLNLMKKIVNITTLVLIVLLIVQVALLFVPFFEDRVPKGTYANDYNPQPTDYSMMDLAFFKTEEMEFFIDKEVESTFGDKKYSPNNYVMGIVYVFALGAVAAVSNMVTRRSFFTHLVSVLWSVVALMTFFGGFGPIMTLANTAQWIYITGMAISIVGTVLVFGRLYPWFAGRFLKKKFIAKEKAAEA